MNDFTFIVLIAIALGVWATVWEVSRGFKWANRRLDRLEELLSQRQSSRMDS